MDQFVFLLVASILSINDVLSAPDTMMIKIREECKTLPGPPAQLGHCCKFPQVDFDEYAMECIKELPWDPTNPVMSACKMHECHFKKSGFMNGSKINKKKVMQFTEKAFANYTMWMESGIKAFDMCIDHGIMYIDDIRDTFASHNFDLTKCDPMFMSVETCAFMYLFRNCPAENWTNNEMCGTWKKHLDMCHSEENTIVMLNNVTVEQMKEEGVVV